ncbi:MAG: hypothetical protein ACI97A_002883 [Planctomycetota bacterium]|jgi:hypothetical protein
MSDKPATERPHGDADNHDIADRSLKIPLIVAFLFLVAAGIGLWYLYSDKSQLETTEVFQAEAPVDMGKGRVKSTNLRFKESAIELGVVFEHVTGSTGSKLLPETMGAGAAFLDFDNDGDQDLMLVNSGSLVDPLLSAKSTQAFFVNENGRFQNRTKEVGLDVSFYGMGVTVGDFDGDGFDDLFVTAVGANHLFRNDQGKRFVDVTEVARVGGGNSWSTGSAFLDHDQDGDLDLLVLNYVEWTAEIDLGQSFSLGSLDRAFGPPTSFKGAQPFFYENLGQGRFKESAKDIGLHVKNVSTGVPVGKSLAVVITDFDGNGAPDIVIANDTVRNFAFKNIGGKFTEVGTELGLAFDENGNARGAMGMDAARFKNDQSTAIAVGNFANEMTAFYVSDLPHDPLFIDEATSVGIGAPSRDSLTFGLLFSDLDLDGYVDLVVANGHVEPDISRVQASQSHEQEMDVFRNIAGKFQRLSGIGTNEKFVGRGIAVADVDGDGDVDLLATANGGRPRLFINQQEGGKSLRLDLRLPGGMRRAIGATVTLESGVGKQHRRLTASGSYLSSSEHILTFGLGGEEETGQIKIVWPDGTVQTILKLAVGSHKIEQQR